MAHNQRTLRRLPKPPAVEVQAHMALTDQLELDGSHHVLGHEKDAAVPRGGCHPGQLEDDAGRGHLNSRPSYLV